MTSASEWTTYDDLSGPGLDPARWAPLDYHGPRIEPNARTTVADGVVTIDVPEFTQVSETDQGLDNSKHVMLSTDQFRIPKDGVARFSADLRSEIRDESGDYRLGFASFNVVDATGGTNLVYNILSNGDRVFAEQELLPGHASHEPFTRIVEDPFFFARLGERPDRRWLACTTELDRRNQRVTYLVDGQIMHVAGGLEEMPDVVHLALGIFTLMPLGSGVRSAHGQGGRASWRRIRWSVAGD